MNGVKNLNLSKDNYIQIEKISKYKITFELSLEYIYIDIVVINTIVVQLNKIMDALTNYNSQYKVLVNYEIYTSGRNICFK